VIKATDQAGGSSDGSIVNMNSKTATGDESRRTAMAPITAEEEIPVLSEQEREELLNSLKEAEARAAAGQTADCDPATFRDRLIEIYRGGKRS
jgi:hypothetical protein